MVVNNQGRIGKALIPFFVLLHLQEAEMGRGIGDMGERKGDTGFMLEWVFFWPRGGNKIVVFVIFLRRRKGEKKGARSLRTGT